MFNESKYTDIYWRIVRRAQSRAWTKHTAPCYIERHHIIPKSKSFGGSNTDDNIVCLTAKEHYICHLLLTKMCSGIQKAAMITAFHRLIYNRVQQHSITSRVYEQSKKWQSESMKGNTRGSNNKGRVTSTQVRTKIRQANILRKRGTSRPLPTGVTWDCGAYKARARVYSKTHHLGRFKTVEEAKMAYDLFIQQNLDIPVH